MRIVILALSITSSWGNGHATTYRALTKALLRRGHEVVVLERDVPWYASHRDANEPHWGQVHLYPDLDDLNRRFRKTVADADLVVVGSYVPQGVRAAEWALETAQGVTAFYDIDTPVTLGKLAAKDHEYLEPGLIPRFDLYLTFSGGPTLRLLEETYGARAARPLYCGVDPEHYEPVLAPEKWALGYMGTWCPGRQPVVDRLLVETARRRPDLRFVVAGPQYPPEILWPANVARLDHVGPAAHPAFYASQRFTLNATRPNMVELGWSPSVRLFEAASCASAILSDSWRGLEDFFEPGREILIEDVERAMAMSPAERRSLGQAARRRVLAEHTADHRAAALEGYHREVAGARLLRG